jgi:hypothetical protein
MEDFDRTPFKNRDITRLTGKTTPPPGTSFAISAMNARDAKRGNTPKQKADAAAKQSMKDAKKNFENMKKNGPSGPAPSGFSSL